MGKRKKGTRKHDRRLFWLGLAILLACCILYLVYEPAVGKQLRTVEENECVSDIRFLDTRNLEIPAPNGRFRGKILRRKNYTLSYNAALNLPDWVAWETNAGEMEAKVKRSNRFLTDPDLPAASAVTSDDYRGSGFDRGHMCPAADNRWDSQAMKESFYMSNMCPQNGSLNRGDWKELEGRCREWTLKDGPLFIVCGPILSGEAGRTIGTGHRVAVPDAFFKVVLCLSPVPKAIGFIYRNGSCNNPLFSYAHSVDEVEEACGLDFFPALPDEVEERIESRYSTADWE